MVVVEQTPARGNSLANLIAWLSLCLLAVGSAPSLDTEWRQVWANAGMFGLVAAVAFVLRQKAIRTLAERRLDHFAAEDKRLATMLQEAHKVGSAI